LDAGQIAEAEREALAPFESRGTENPYTIHQDLQDTMQSLVGIFRNEEDLNKALVELDKLKSRAAHTKVEGSRLFNPGWHLAFDLKSMLAVSEAVTRSAIARRESRGGHARIDFPNYDPAWEKKHNVIVKKGNEMTRMEWPSPEIPEELQKILAEDK
jgi:succinate dehydrogenase / fumarate reductase flavoprotein subunit